MTFPYQFERRVARIPFAECWYWIGWIDADGYGLYDGERRDGKKRVRRAHRVAYELAKGPIPDGLTIDHLCRNRGCVNPDHLRAVTAWENVKAGQGPTALNVRKTACQRGHPFDGVNSYADKWQRRCRTCLREAARRRRKRKATLRSDRQAPAGAQGPR